MGEVHLVRDNDMQRSIAVKRLNDCESPAVVERFVAEIRTVAQLEHPNIMPVHDVGVDADGHFFFIMKHLKGQTLEELIGQLKASDPSAHQRWPFPVRARLFLGVLNAIAYAHERGVLHRDLKPANIMVGAFGEVTVMDWGISCKIAPPALTASACDARAIPAQESLHPEEVRAAAREPDNQLVGTPLYSSPEQVRRENSKLDQRSDVYALGVLFYELLFLEHYLAHCRTLEDVFRGVQEFSPETQTARARPGQLLVPPELGWFVARAMKKDPSERFQSVHEMRDALERLLAGRFPVQCQRTAFKRALNELMAKSDRHPIAVILGSTLLFSLLLMGAVRALLGLF